MQRVLLLNVVGLTPALLGQMSWCAGFANRSGLTPLRPPFPAVTTTCQATMSTGGLPADHGIVGNGWYDRETAEVRFWQRSNRLIQGEQLWDTARQRDPNFTCANLFWWYNTYADCETVVQVRPQYHANGNKVSDLWSQPPELRHQLQADSPQGLGRFPLFKFWGPGANIESTHWIAEATKRVLRNRPATLTQVYLPHLDYPLQRLGPESGSLMYECAGLDRIVEELIDDAEQLGIRPIIVSEYGIEACQPTNAAIAINRVLRDAGLLAIREENGRELLEAGASKAFAVADHQVAQVYHDADVEIPDIPHATRATIDHPRAGDTCFVADPGHWFCYDYWPIDQPDNAPDFARTVDIHRKPGYDPRELFLGRSVPAVALKVLRKKLGLRGLFDVIPLDNDLVRGTHGRVPAPDALDDHPVLIGAGNADAPRDMRDVKQVLLEAIFD